MASAAAELVVERQSEPLLELQDTNRTFVGAEGLVRMALDQYTEILATASDPRVSDWPLMDSPIPVFFIVVLYLYTVTLLGPRLMTNQKPFHLRSILVAYNAFQVIFSLGMMYEVNITIIFMIIIIPLCFFVITNNLRWNLLIIRLAIFSNINSIETHQQNADSVAVNNSKWETGWTTSPRRFVEWYDELKPFMKVEHRLIAGIEQIYQNAASSKCFSKFIHTKKLGFGLWFFFFSPSGTFYFKVLFSRFILYLRSYPDAATANFCKCHCKDSFVHECTTVVHERHVTQCCRVKSTFRKRPWKPH